MSTGQIHHLNFKVSDLKTSSDFWGWFLEQLGYTEYDRWPKGISFKLGSTYIDFVQSNDKYAEVPHNRESIGLNHIAFHGESRTHIDELTMLLKDRGMKILYEDQHPFAGGPDYYAVYFEDPNGIKIEIVAP